MESFNFESKIKIHFHTDCSFFAGCENMIANFLNSDEFRDEFELSISYRSTKIYEQGRS